MIIFKLKVDQIFSCKLEVEAEIRDGIVHKSVSWLGRLPSSLLIEYIIRYAVTLPIAELSPDV